jgi:ElaB/YqjD/DUF883 family membrane-anchored ribosome-binding protein
MSTTSDQLDKQAKDVTEDLQEMGATLRDAARVKLGRVGARASECCEHARDKVHGAACACEEFVRQRPLTSVLLAAGAGVLLGCFWKVASGRFHDRARK